MKPKQLFEDNVFCPAPWNNLYINPNGDVQTCSIGTSKLGDLHSDDITDLVKDNVVLQEIQQSMIEGRRHKNCSQCHQVEDYGIEYSLRSHYKKTITNFNNLEQYNSGNGNLHITGLDLRYDNTCQNACVYCYPVLSSRWEKELGVSVSKPENTNKTKEYVLKNLLIQA